MDKGDHHFGRQSRSAWAKIAAAFLRTSLAAFELDDLALERLQVGALIRRQARTLAAVGSACRTHRRSVSVVQPTLGAIASIAAHCEPCSPAWSRTSRTKRSRTSGECLLGRAMGPSSQRIGPPTIPARLSRLTVAFGPDDP
jgi:hypothetical protein